MKKIFGGIAILSLLCLPACKTPASIAEITPQKVVAQEKKQDIPLLSSFQKTFNEPYFSASFQGSYELGKDGQTFAGQLRINKNKEIWISITKIGIEVLRARMTPDSIYLMNRFERSIWVRPISYLTNFVGPINSLGLLQDVFWGLCPIDKQFLSRSFTEPSATAPGKTSGIKDSLTWNYEFTKNGPLALLSSAEIKTPDNMTVTIAYSNYKEIENAQVPGRITIAVSGKIQASFALSFSKISNELIEFPFTIPQSYKAQ